MTQRIPRNFSTVDWSLVATMGNMMPPRDPNDDDDAEDEDEDAEPDDLEPAVVREPDEDERRRSRSIGEPKPHQRSG